jgi:hypothetical protein
MHIGEALSYVIVGRLGINGNQKYRNVIQVFLAERLVGNVFIDSCDLLLGHAVLVEHSAQCRLYSQFIKLFEICLLSVLALRWFTFFQNVN